MTKSSPSVFANTEDSDSDFAMARLSPREALDATFGVDGIGKVRTSLVTWMEEPAGPLFSPMERLSPCDSGHL